MGGHRSRVACAGDRRQSLYVLKAWARRRSLMRRSDDVSNVWSETLARPPPSFQKTARLVILSDIGPSKQRSRRQVRFSLLHRICVIFLHVAESSGSAGNGQ